MENAADLVQLAHQRDFNLGAAVVRPSLAEVVSGHQRVRLQPRVMQVLVALAQADGAVLSRDDLLLRCWGGTTVGEDALNRCIQRLRKLSAELPGNFSIETLPRVGYRLERIRPPAAGAGEPANGTAGGKVADDGDGQRASLDRPARPLLAPGWRRGGVIAAAAGVAALAVALGVVAIGAGGAPKPRPKVSIAVAPLQMRAGDVPAQIIRAGLSNDLARAMVANPLQISVAALGPGSAQPPPGRLILDGNAFTTGSGLQAQLHLRDAASQEILWSKTFTGDAAAADALREQAALKVGAVLNCALHTRQSADVSDEALRLYFNACDRIGEGEPPAALDQLRRLTALAPRFAQAWAELAATVASSVDELEPAQRRAAYKEAIEDAQRALRLDPNTGLAYFAEVQATPGIENWSRRVALIQKGLQVEPNAAELDNELGGQLRRVGRLNEAIVHFERATDLDPLSPVKTASLIAALTDAAEYEEAEALSGKAARIWPRNEFIWSRAFLAEARLGDARKAMRMLDDPDRPTMREPTEAAYWRARLRYRLDPSEANRKAVIARMQSSNRLTDPGRELGRAYELALLDRVDLAYRTVLPAARTVDESSALLLFRPEMKSFRADPRFMTLAKRLGLVAIWRSTGRWPDFCTAARAPYDCAAAAERAPD